MDHLDHLFILRKFYIQPLLRRIALLCRDIIPHILLLVGVVGVAYSKWLVFLRSTPFELPMLTPIYLILGMMAYLMIDYFKQSNFHKKELIFFASTPVEPKEYLGIIMARQHIVLAWQFLVFALITWPIIYYPLHKGGIELILFLGLAAIGFLRIQLFYQSIRMHLVRYNQWLILVWMLNILGCAGLFLYYLKPFLPLITESTLLILNILSFHHVLKASGYEISHWLLNHSKKKAARRAIQVRPEKAGFQIKKFVIHILSLNSRQVGYTIGKYFQKKNLGFLFSMLAVVTVFVFLFTKSRMAEPEEVKLYHLTLLIVFNFFFFTIGLLIYDTVSSSDLYRYKLSPLSFSQITLKEISASLFLFFGIIILGIIGLFFTNPIFIITAIPAMILYPAMGWYLNILFQNTKIIGEVAFSLLFVVLMIGQMLSPVIFYLLGMLIIIFLTKKAQKKYQILEF